jgi:hypothetical protein
MTYFHDCLPPVKMFGVPPKCQWPKVQGWRTQKAQKKKHKKRKTSNDTSLIPLCAFCVVFALFVFHSSSLRRSYISLKLATILPGGNFERAKS